MKGPGQLSCAIMLHSYNWDYIIPCYDAQGLIVHFCRLRLDDTDDLRSPLHTIRSKAPALAELLSGNARKGTYVTGGVGRQTGRSCRVAYGRTFHGSRTSCAGESLQSFGSRGLSRRARRACPGRRGIQLLFVCCYARPHPDDACIFACGLAVGKPRLHLIHEA